MADSGEKKSASANPKEKKSLLDEEIGKDFLSSWKSMSVTEDDTMDFSFDTVPNGKKKFNFDKLDMDFNLDGDFDKLSSFKVDMPDLDFSCPSKKTAKTKERMEEDSPRENQEVKKDHFNFSFDFNDEDFANDAKIGSKSVGNSKSLIRELADDEPILLRNVKDANNLSSIGEGFSFDDVQNKSNLVGDLRIEDEQVTQREPVMLGNEKNIGEDFHAMDVQIGSKLVGNSISITRELREAEPGLLRSENNVKNLSDVREGVESDGVHNESKLSSDVRPQDKQVAEGEFVKPGSEKNIREGFDSNDDAEISNKLVGSKSLSRELTKESASLRSEKNVRSLSNISEVINTDGVQNSSKLSNSRPQDKEAMIGEPVMLRSEKGSSEVINVDEVLNCSKVCDSRPQGKERKAGEPVKLRNEKNSGEVANADGVQHHSKVGNLNPQDKEAKAGEPVKLRSQKNSREVTNADGVQHHSKVGNLNPQDKEAKTGVPVKLRSEKNSRFQVNSSTLNEKIPKLSTQATGNPKFVVPRMHSIQNLKNVSVEGLKTGKRTPDLSSLKNLRTTGAIKDMPNSTVLRQSSSFRNSEHTIKLPGITTSTAAQLVGGTEKQKPVTPSLKRKKIEELNADLVSLKPLKRLSESPKESRKCKESLGRVIGEVCNHENQGQSKTKNVLHEHSSSGLEDAWAVSMIPLVMENDGNVEKAEAYTKELEDICNMLKKKHEEAKEILVRAIVNNNNLLMLNHPIYEEKIHMVQKFAMELVCKEIQT